MRALLAAILFLLATPALADRRVELEAAGRLLLDGKYPEAEQQVAPLLADPQLAPAERAEARRIRGLALFFLGQRAEAEAALAAYLQLDPSAHLDPSLYPPEAVVFFEEVRTRQAGKLRAAKPRRRSGALNFLPPLGQVQNGDYTKAWIIGAAEISLLAVNIGTYVMLSSSCSDDLTCDRDYSAAKAMRVVNLASGALLLGVYAYGVIDGYVGYGRLQDAERRVRLGLVPLPGGAAVGATARF